MFMDASIVVAILAKEDGWEALMTKMESFRGHLKHSPAVRFETVIALVRLWRQRNASASKEMLFHDLEKLFDEFVAGMESVEIDITSDMGLGALAAARTYGKAVGHTAGLNFGDCFSYAAAKALGVGLLSKGNDFALTDLG